jgi:SAM-dependent methyltransferase
MFVREWMERRRRRPGRYIAVEPNPAHVVELRQTLASLELDSRVDETEFDVDYPMSTRFDLVLFSHSLYWMTDPVACMRHARDALAPGGRVVAFLQAPFGVHPMYRLFDPQFVRDRPPGQDQAFSSAELVVGLRAAGLEPTIDMDPTPIDLTGLFAAGNEAERDDFVSFCLQIEFSALDEPLRSDVLTYLRAAGVEKDGRLLWYEPTATVVLRAR